MNPKLYDAVEIFKALGWEQVTPENILTLPLGSKEQKQIALAGLKSGEWGKIAQLSKNSYGWKSYLDVNTSKLALFAIRLGVDARRAVNIANRADSEMLLTIIIERGEKYALDFITYACTSDRRIWVHSASAFGNLAVQIVAKLGLAIPHHLQYIKDWAVYAAKAMEFDSEIPYKETNLPTIDIIEKYFAEHISVGIAVNAPATGPFGIVFPAGVKRGWLPYQQAIELVFFALDAAVRPGDRKVWLNVLDQLSITDDMICERAQSLIPLLALGDDVVITKFAPILITKLTDDLLIEVLMASFSATSKKTKRLVLKSALTCSRPNDVECLVPWLSIFASDSDKSISTLARKLIELWQVAITPEQQPNNEIQHYWQATPPLWQVPLFELGETTPEALTELTAKLVNQAAIIYDINTERFLAVANAVAYQDAKSARMSLRGLRSGEPIIDFMINWVKDELPKYGFDTKKRIYELLLARDYMVCLHLDKIPCLLSTPSFDNLSITVADLVHRLSLYQQAGIDVLEADLFLALTRLDLNSKNQKLIKALHKLDMAIVLQSGTKLAMTAGQAVLSYLEHPIKEPKLEANKYGYWGAIKVSNPIALSEFPERLNQYQQDMFAIFPNWGDAALESVRWDCEVYHQQGLILRQVVRRPTILPLGASINLLASQRSLTPDAAADAMLAVQEAWQRGLLQPGNYDISLLDWRASSPPSNLAALALALDGIAKDGMLSVVWPILDSIIEVSMQAPRMLTGTAELVSLIAEFLPEVQLAIDKHLVDVTAFNLPGVRALAKRNGSSLAVTTAKKIVACLPAIQVVNNVEDKPAPVMDRAFDEVWPTDKKVAPLIDDGVTINIRLADPELTKKFFLFELTLPDISDRVFQIVKNGWIYDLESEGQCRAHYASLDVTTYQENKDNIVWLHWDPNKKAMVVCNYRNWVDQKDGSLSRSSKNTPPLTSSLLTVAIGLLAQDGDAVYYAPRLLEKLIENEKIDAMAIDKITTTLLQHSVISPAKLVRYLEKDINLLYVFWPMLTLSIQKAGTMVEVGEKPPVWVNRVLDVALYYAPYLVEAIKRGYIPTEQSSWIGLSSIAASKAKSAAITKAKQLLAVLAITS